MYDQTKHRIKVIQAKDPLVFQRQYNEAAEELDKYDPDITVEHEGGTHIAYFMYTLHIATPETVRDEFTLAGIHHTCSECPFLEIGQDARRKRWPCRYSEYGTSSIDHEACEVLLKKLMAGTVRLRDVNSDMEVEA